MRLAHPAPQPLPPLHPRRVAPPPHPRPEVLGARPARVQAREEGQELPHLRLLGRRGGGRVRGRERVQEGPGGAAEGVGVRGAVGGRGWWWGGGGGWGSGRVGGGGDVFSGHGGPGGEGGAGAAAGVVVSSFGIISLMRSLFAGSGWTHGLPSLPSTTPLGIAFFSGAVGSSGSAVGF